LIIKALTTTFRNSGAKVRQIFSNVKAKLAFYVVKCGRQGAGEQNSAAIVFSLRHGTLPLADSWGQQGKIADKVCTLAV
jgi:hypothetical protein